MNELDYLEDVYFGKKTAKDDKELAKLRGLYEYCWGMKPPSKPSVHAPYNLLTFLAKMAPKECATEFITEKLQSYGYLQKNQQFDDDLVRRVEYAFNWARDFEEIKESAVNLSNEERNAIAGLLKTLDAENEPEKIQNAIFNAAKTSGLPPSGFFKTLYMVLMGTPQGPRLGPYILAMGKQNVIVALQRALNKQ
jgi:lysyl-tRNA synthetase class 1